MASGGEVGVTLFVLITGYFSCDKKIIPQKLLNIYLQTLFFSVLIFLFFCAIDYNTAIRALSYSLFPFTHSAYWFVSSWLLMLFFSPLLNAVFNACSPQTIKKYLLGGAIIWVILPTFNLGIGYSNLIYFMYLYLLGGAIKAEYISFSKLNDGLKRIFILVSCGILTLLISNVIFSIFLFPGKIFWSSLEKIFVLNSFYTFFLSIWIFHIFKKLNIKSDNINWIASSMFGVYLIHDNQLVRPYLWHTLLQMDYAMNSPYFVVWVFIVSICIFCLCIVLDKILSLFYTPLIKCIENKLEKITLLKRYF